MPLITEKGKWGLYLASTNNTFQAAFTFKPEESFSWAQPLNEDRSKYYLTHRNVAVKMEGNYIFEDQKFYCNNDCLMGEDSVRASMNWPTNYWQVQVQTFLPDGRTFGVFLGDGVGSHLLNKQSSEDFATLDGKVIKLGMTRLTEDATGIMSNKKVVSI